jgi:hypothetical protein
LTFPFFGDFDRWRAAAEMPTVVGEMMPLRFRVGLQQPLGLLEGLLVVVVAVGDLHELDVLVLGLLELRLHELDPGVLVGRVRGRREDRDLALAADLLRDQLHLALADQRRRGLVDEHRTLVRRHVGVHVQGHYADLRALGEQPAA